MKPLLITLLTLLCSCCTPGGTLEPLNKFQDDSKIELYRYYYDTDAYVYVARFKDSPNVVSTTWHEVIGKSRFTRGNVIIFENDSIQINFKEINHERS